MYFMDGQYCRLTIPPTSIKMDIYSRMMLKGGVRVKVLSTILFIIMC